MSRSRQIAVIALLALVCAAAGFAAREWLKSDPPPAVDAAAVLMSATLKGLNDEPQALAQWRGKVLIVNFWATWCAPCREEIPVFIQFQSAYAARGVQFLGIAIDQKEKVAPYAREIGINYPLLVGGLEVMELSRQAGNRAGVLPFTVIISRDGRTAIPIVGIVKPAKLEQILAQLL